MDALPACNRKWRKRAVIIVKKTRSHESKHEYTKINRDKTE